MRSLYDDIFTALTEGTYSIPDVTIREPFDESAKTYPLIVLHEIVNVPQSHGTVAGEGRTALSYQLDISTQNCLDTDGNVLSRSQAGRMLVGEVNDILDAAYKWTRRNVQPDIPTAADVVTNIIRGDVVLDSYGYAYRP